MSWITSSIAGQEAGSEAAIHAMKKSQKEINRNSFVSQYRKCCQLLQQKSVSL